MRNITARNISKSFGRTVALDGVSLSLSEGDRIAVVGENGAGKSTLLKVLSGTLEADSGELFGMENGCAYIAQDFSGQPDETPRAFISRHVRNPKRTIQALEAAGFNLGPSQTRLDETTCQHLSGGEQKKLEIAVGLTSGARFVFLDEPENHLDYETIAWLIEMLSNYHGGIMFVSHDQYFIDQLTTTIFELHDGSVTAYTMKYDEYLAEKVRQIGGQTRQWQMEEKTISRLRETVAMMRVRAARSSNTARTYQQHKRQLATLESQHGHQPSADSRKPTVRLRSVDQKGGKRIATIQDLDFSYGDAPVFKGAEAELRFGEKVVLFGRNGSGKSTLLRLLTGELLPDAGSTAIGVNVRWQRLSQSHLEGLDPERSAIEAFHTLPGWNETRIRNQLAKYGIGADLATRPLRVLSGGQQARFKLACTFAANPEFLILDEPTNHVDPPTWEAIVEAVRDFSGTVLAVTHDRMFIDAIAEKLWVIKNQSIHEELGTLSDHLAR